MRFMMMVAAGIGLTIWALAVIRRPREIKVSVETLRRIRQSDGAGLGLDVPMATGRRIPSRRGPMSRYTDAVG